MTTQKTAHTTKKPTTMGVREMEFHGIEFPNAHEAIQWAEADGRGTAIAVDGKNFVVDEKEANRLAEAGSEFAYLYDHEMPDGSHRIMTVPIN